MSELSESQLGFVRDWISHSSRPMRVPVLKPVDWRGIESTDPVPYDTVTIENRRVVLPAPWTGKKELFYSCRVAVLDDELIAVSSSTLGETGRPWYDPTIWLNNFDICQVLNRIS